MFNVKDKTRSKFIICLFLVVIILASYWQFPSHGYLSFDENEYITKNTCSHERFTWKNIARAFSNTDFGYWHPLTYPSHLLAFKLFGLKFGIQHLINLLLHISNTLLLFFVLKKNDRRTLEKCLCRCCVCITSSECGVGCVGIGTKKCFEHLLLDADDIDLYTIHRSTWFL